MDEQTKQGAVVGENITVGVKDGHLYLDIDLEDRGTWGQTSTGKSWLVASSHGWASLEAVVRGFKLSLNVVKVKGR